MRCQILIEEKILMDGGYQVRCLRLLGRTGKVHLFLLILLVYEAG